MSEPISDFIYAPPQGEIPILYEDEDILLVNKPSGLLSVPGKTEALQDCLETRLKKRDHNVRLIHRLDMDTSGLMIFARTHQAQKEMGRQFESRKIQKTYKALVAGKLREEEGVIDAPLMTDWPRRPLQKICVREGKPAQTRFKRLEFRDGNSLVALYPKTGRSHQLRVHMLSLGHPILGDRFYAPRELAESTSRLMLHAERLEFTHPKTGAEMSIQAHCDF